jgi:hypothetical protein
MAGPYNPCRTGREPAKDDNHPEVRAIAEVERARELYALRARSDAHAALSAADGHEPLGAGDLERLATAAYMIGRRRAA